MRKFILFFVLLVIFLSLAVFLGKVFLAQKNNPEQTEDNSNTTQETKEIVEVKSYYKDYSKKDYDEALNEKRVMVLYFTSNWCQVCINQDFVNDSIFQELDKEGIVGLRIHILDSETTTETDALSKKFGITKEQSYVVLDKNGVVSFKHTGTIDKEQLKQKILEAR